ncbi:MAG: vWA domain-containing protein [Pseudobdellovibrionaceae bacterium]
MTTSKSLILIFGMTFSLACTKTDFAPAELIDQGGEETESFETTAEFQMKPVEEFFEQDLLTENKTSLILQVLDSRGFSVPGLKAQDFKLTENSVDVSKFQVSSSSVNLGQRADIVFVFDHTSSMEGSINDAKNKVKEFVEKLRAKNIQALLCLVTFKDKTTKKCDRIVEDNPRTPTNENLDAFLDELTRLEASGGGDMDENQLRALIDAASVTPWRANSQRISILVTDAGFHYTPGNEGDAKKDAPRYEEAVVAIRKAQMSVFAVAPDEPGYNSNFQSFPALTQIMGGGYFKYRDLLRGRITMESIFSSIVDQISTQYQIEYISEENPGLDPELPLKDRQIFVTAGNAAFTVKKISQLSNFPDGRIEGKKKFRLSKEPRRKLGRIFVKVNGVPLTTGFRVERDELVFQKAPPSKSRIELLYDPEDLRDSFQLSSLVLPADLELNTLRVAFNDVTVGFAELRLSRDSEGRLILDPGSIVFSLEDPYRLFERKGLKIQVFGLRRFQSR